LLLVLLFPDFAGFYVDHFGQAILAIAQLVDFQDPSFAIGAWDLSQNTAQLIESFLIYSLLS
jgi:hypothetical protein